MAKGGPKQYPNLSAYLDKATKPMPANVGVVFQALLAIIGSISFIGMVVFGGITMVSSGFGYGFPAVALGILVSGVCSLGVVASQKLIPKSPRPTPLEIEAKQVNLLLKKHLKDRRLHKAGPEAVITLLEEIARQYQRIQATMNTPFWKATSLPEPYHSLREKARLAADRAINESVVLLRPMLTENAKPQDWRDIVEEVAENIGFKTPDRGFVFPAEIEPARNLAEGLRSLANEVESASIRAITDIPNSNSAESSLRSCLSELRSLNQAEDELDESLKYRL